MGKEVAAVDKPSMYLGELLVDGEAVERWVIRASGLGGCSRALLAAAKGIQGQSPPDWMQERFDEGHDWEERILAKVRAGDVVNHGDHAWQWPVVKSVTEVNARVQPSVNLPPSVHLPATHGDQIRVEMPVGTGAVIRGHLDDIAIYEGMSPVGADAAVLEAKFLAPSMIAKFHKDGIQAFPYYATQASIYIATTGLPLVFAVGEKILTSGEGMPREVELGDVHVQLLTEPPVKIPVIKARVAKLIRDAGEGLLPDSCDTRQYPCPYWWMGEGACSKKPAEEIELVDDRDLAVAVIGYRQGMEWEAAGKAAKKKWAPIIAERIATLKAKGAKVRVDLSDPEDGAPEIVTVTDHVETREARTVTYKAGEVRYPKIGKG